MDGIMKRYSILFLLTLLMIVTAASCREKPLYPVDRVPAGSSLQKIVPPEEPTSHDYTARFIAGMLSADDTGPAAVTAFSEYYREYQSDIDRGWKGFFVPNMKKIQVWRNEFLAQEFSSNIFYPFSGPDILHPLSFFPEGRDILMFGLEPTGGIPSVEGLTPDQLKVKLRTVAPALNFQLHHAFFVTKDMQEKVGRDEFSGITGILFFFLARGEFHILQAREIHLTEEGLLQNGKGLRQKGMVQGVEIIFTKGPGHPLKRLRYFRLDIGNGSSQLPRFLAYAKKYGTFSTIVKSASYLMTWHTFSDIRNFVLNNSETILQDDSGIPFQYLRKGPWNLTAFGKYHYPLPVFRDRYQRDLEQYVAQNSKGPIPFVYGYGYGYADMTYHLILARKKEEGQ